MEMWTSEVRGQPGKLSLTSKRVKHFSKEGVSLNTKGFGGLK